MKKGSTHSYYCQEGQLTMWEGTVLWGYIKPGERKTEQRGCECDGTLARIDHLPTEVVPNLSLTHGPLGTMVICSYPVNTPQQLGIRFKNFTLYYYSKYSRLAMWTSLWPFANWEVHKPKTGNQWPMSMGLNFSFYVINSIYNPMKPYWPFLRIYVPRHYSI